MAKLKSPLLVQRLLEALQSGLSEAGIRAEVDAEPIRGTRLHRIYVVARAFEALPPSERQDLVWRIAGQVMTPQEQLKISMILTLTPDELDWAEERLPR